MKNKTLTKILSVFMACLFVLGTFTCVNLADANLGLKAGAVNKETTVSGEGWTLYSDGDLIITANITADEEGKFPWSENVDKVVYVSLYGEDVTAIADGAFTGTSLKEIYIPTTVTSISKHAFDDEDGNVISTFETIYYEGSSTDFDALNSGINTTSISVVYHHTHSTVVTNKVVADCENRQDGYTGDTYCSECHALVEEGTVVSYTDAHVWSEEKQLYSPATCATNVDIYASKCTKPNCGAWKNDWESREHIVAHNYSIVYARSSEACGTQGATYTAECSECGRHQAIAVPDEHVYIAGESKDATCTEAGYTTEICQYCSAVDKKTEVAALNHPASAKKTTTTDPTCLTAGEEVTYCSLCGDKLLSQFIPATGHNYGTDFTIVTEPTCTEPGSKVKYCLNKGCDSYIEKTIIPVHTTESYSIEKGNAEYKIVNPTCSAKGSKTLVCKECGEAILDAEGNEIVEIIPVDTSAHVAGEWDYNVYPATCTDDGYRVKYCTECGMELNKDVVYAIGHHFEFTTTVDCTEGGGTAVKTCKDCDLQVEVTVPSNSEHETEIIVVDPTCTEKGYSYETCKVPGCSYKSGEYNVKAALGHDYDDGVITTEPTCTEAGVKTYTCKNDSTHTYTEEVSASGHNWTHDIKKATCAEAGYDNYVCSVCGLIDEEQSIVLPITGHTIDANGVVTKPTCTEKGYTTYSCSVCGMSYTDSYTDALGHDLKENVIDPTCTEAGYTEMRCSRDGCTYSEKAEGSEKDALGHTEVVDAAVAPTCTETGLTEGSHCSVCGAVINEQKEVSAKGHTLSVTVAVAPTCTETGLTEGKVCTVCKTVIAEQSVVPATGHTEVIDAAVAPTCTKSGLTEGSHCSVCDAVIKAQETVEATGHTEVTDAAKAATCTEKGLTEGKHCSVCGLILVAQEEIAALGHKEETIPAVKATCETAGKTEGKKCSVCGAITVAPHDVSATGHNFVEQYTKTAATAFKSGVKVYKCSVCGKLQESNYELTFVQKVTWVFNKVMDFMSSIFDYINNAA